MVTDLRIRHSSPLIRRKRVAMVEPVPVSGALAALAAVIGGRRGLARWAVSVWACALVGPVRDQPKARDADDLPGAGSVESLTALIGRLDPASASVRWPRWIGAGRDPVVLELGIAQGKSGVRTTCEIPPGVRDLVVPVQGGALGELGLCRARMPRWSGSAVSSDGRLGALVELVAQIDGTDPGEVATLVRWCCGPGRSSPQVLGPDDSGWAQRRAASAMSVVDPAAVVAAVLG